MKTYAISDIHGCYNTFNELLNQIGLNKTDRLFLLGDYIDRGKHSIKTLDKIIQLQKDGFNIQCLIGNHEEMLLESYLNPSISEMWLVNGGRAVLSELDIEHPNQLPQKYIDFIKRLKYYIEVDDYIFVHAGLNADVFNPLNDKKSLVWIRNWEDNPYLEEFLGGRKVIHGHTPQMRTKIEKRFSNFAQHFHSVLNIDNGCFFEKDGYNSLCCVNLTDNQLHFQKNCD
jgi:serine/threonine protein phosphatase 1